MSKNIIPLFILLVSFSAYGYKINPEFYAVEEFFLKVGETRYVPKCHRIVLRDINNLNGKVWVQIEGTLQIAEGFSFSASPSHYMKGIFTYSTHNGLPSQKVVVNPGSHIKVMGEKGGRIPVLEGNFMKEGECPNKS